MMRPGNARGLALAEVMIALLVVGLALGPLLALLRQVSAESLDADALLALVEDGQEAVLAAAPRPVSPALSEVSAEVSRGAHVLRCRISRADPVGSFAPPAGVAPGGP